MSRHRPLVMILGLAGAFVLPGAALWARGHEDAAKLTEEIQRQRNPVRKAKLEIRLARLHLQQMVDAYDHNRMRQGQQLLGEYFQEMNESWAVLKSSGRNAAKNPSGFMQLEIALRENARVLNDLRERIVYPNQGPVEKTLGALNQLHSQVLLALFPGAAPPGATPPKDPKAGANRFAGKESHP